MCMCTFAFWVWSPQLKKKEVITTDGKLLICVKINLESRLLFLGVFLQVMVGVACKRGAVWSV